MFFPTLDLFACYHICGRLHSAYEFMANWICEMFHFEVASVSFGRQHILYDNEMSVFDIFFCKSWCDAC